MKTAMDACRAIGMRVYKEVSMIGKRIALALTVGVLGVGLSLAPADLALAKKCPTRGKIFRCVRAHKKAADCKHKPKAERKACRDAVKLVFTANCHTCGTSPSGAFLDLD